MKRDGWRRGSATARRPTTSATSCARFTFDRDTETLLERGARTIGFDS
jgi:hypothetical protein